MEHGQAFRVILIILYGCIIIQGATGAALLRLVNGDSPNEGRVEVFYTGVWGTVCDDNWDTQDATVVCRQLGFNPNNAQAFQSAHFGEGSGRIWLDEVACIGYELELDDCSHNGWGAHDCGHDEDAGVICMKDKPPSMLEVDIGNGAIPSRASVEVIAGSSTTFTGEASGAESYQPMTVRWYLNGLELSHTGSNVPNDPPYSGIISRTTIPITWIQHQYTLHCEVRHYALSQLLDHFLTLDIKVPPSFSNTALTDSDTPDGYTPGDTAILTEGTPNEFTCNIVGTRPNTLVAWFIGSQEQTTNIDTVTRENTGDALLSDTTSKFTLSPTREDHYNDVKCLAVIMVSGIPPSTFPVKLAVLGPPDDPVFSGKDLIENDPNNKLTCTSRNGFPAGNITWFSQENIDITNTSTQIDTENPTKRIDMTSLLEYNPSREDNGKTFRCKVHHQTITGPPYPQASVEANVSFCPAHVTMDHPDGIIEGTSVILTCNSSSSNPPVEFLWEGLFIVDGFNPGWEVVSSTYEYIYEDAEYNGKSTSQKFATDENITRHDHIYYSCCTRLPELTCERSRCHNLEITIFYSPDITSVQVPSSHFFEDTLVTLSCNVDANPAPLTRWQRDGIDVPDGHSSTFEFITTRASAGYYRCVANNGIGNETVSEEHPLTVLYAASITSKSENLFRGLEGSIVTAHCTTVANPRPHIAWSGPNGDIPVNGTERIHVEEIIDVMDEVRGTIVTGVLTISGFSPDEDTGTYTCEAGNSNGHDVHSVQVAEATRPQPPVSVDILDDMLTPTSITIQWVAGDDGGIGQWFLVSYSISEEGSDFGPEEKVERSSDEIIQHVVENLITSTKYVIRIFAANEVDRSEIATFSISFTLPISPKEKDIFVTYYTKRNEVTVSNYHGNKYECLQLEISDDNGGNWTEFEECISDNRAYPVNGADPQSVQFVSRMCLVEDGDIVMCGESSTADVDDSNEVNIILAIALSVSAFVCVALIIAIIVGTLYVRRRHKQSNTDSQYQNSEEPSVQMNAYVNRGNSDQDNESAIAKANAKKRKDYETRKRMPLPPVPGGLQNDAFDEGPSGRRRSKSTGQGAIRSVRPDMPEVSSKFWIPFEQLEIGDTLGEGHYGSVAKGRWKTRWVAVKTLKEEATKEYRESMKTELKTMIDVTAKCTNPNVARLLGWSYYEDNLYIVMEYLSGGSLLDFLKNETEQGVIWRRKKKGGTRIDPNQLPARLTSRDVYQFAIDVARGMEYLSDHNIVHRDLAARNVLMDANQTCKVSDFGLARNVMGSGEYVITSMKELPSRWMAIESLMTSTFTVKSDVWSFGVLLWEITAFGRKPYVDDGVESRYLRVKLSQGVRLRPKDSCPPTMKQIMKECWNEDPDDRPDFKEIRVGLENGMRGDPDTVSSVC